MSYEKDLKSAIAEWSKDPIEDEWAFEKFRQDAIYSMSSAEAFEAIDTTVEYLMLEKNESNVVEITQTIINLAGHSNTTELPKELIENKNIISKQFEMYGSYTKNKLTELFDFYRL